MTPYAPGELVKVSIPGTRPYLATVVLDCGETLHVCPRWTLSGKVHVHARQFRVAPADAVVRATPAQVRNHLRAIAL